VQLPLPPLAFAARRGEYAEQLRTFEMHAGPGGVD
jgi:hypothetical protein